jgi:hemerythrin-like domain-containing protein
MPITIGAKRAADFSNPIALLSDCHRRIERFLAVLVSIARQAHGGPMTEEQRNEWLRALDYFRNAAPRHTADEEESLFPRLRQMEHPQVRDAFAKLQELEKDHEQAARWHEEVDQLGRWWIVDAALKQEDAERLTQALNRLTKLYAHHLVVEEESVFPLAAAVLPHTEKAHIGIEMAERRGLNAKRTLEQAGELAGLLK